MLIAILCRVRQHHVLFDFTV